MAVYYLGQLIHNERLLFALQAASFRVFFRNFGLSERGKHSFASQVRNQNPRQHEFIFQAVPTWKSPSQISLSKRSMPFLRTVVAI